MGTDGGPGTKGPVVCVQLFNSGKVLVNYRDTQRSQNSWLTLYRVILVHKVPVAILDPLDLQDRREAPVSLVSKDNW